MKSFSIRIEEALLEKLHYISAYHDRSTNSQVINLIKQAMENFEEKNGAIPTDKER